MKRLSIPSTVTVIARGTFQYCERLTEVELNDGLLEIGDGAFSMCSALKRVEIPSTVVRIGDRAFEYAPVSIQLPDSIENIDQRALANNKTITNFRIPPLIRSISSGVLADCESLFSLELPESIYMGMMPFSNCISLRNIALPYDVSILGRGIRGPFQFCDDLKELFDTDNQITNALQHRFDNLPIHKMIYYQSYNNVTPDQLNSALDMRSGQRRSARMKLDQTGKQQDCLGMTPLHIIACSTVQNIELYKVLVAKYPDNLITKDRWGAVPLLYAVWGNAPSEVIRFLIESHQETLVTKDKWELTPLLYAVWGKVPSEIIRFLVESYQSLYPNQEFNLTQMMATLSKAKVSNDVIRTLLDIQQELVPDLNWEEWIGELTAHDHISQKTFRFLVQCGFTERVNAIGLKQYRDGMMGEMEKSFSFGKVVWLDSVRSKLIQYEEEYHTLKEATTILELALWKYKMEESDTKKKRKRTYESDSDFREQCRVGCSADIVIEHVLPFLVPRCE